jgi:hypothetical protein
MPKLNDANWYAEKRAMAYVYSLFAMHDEAVLTEERHRNDDDNGVDLLIDLSEPKKLMMPRRFAVQIKGLRDLPSVKELNKRLGKDPGHRLAKAFEMPVLLSVVQFSNLRALYCWIVEPIVEDGKAGLRIPDECNWTEFQKDAVEDVLAKVNVFYEALYDVEVTKKRK